MCCRFKLCTTQPKLNDISIGHLANSNQYMEWPAMPANFNLSQEPYVVFCAPFWHISVILDQFNLLIKLRRSKEITQVVSLDRGHIDQIRARVSCRLFLKSIYPKDFRNSLVSLVGWHKSKLTYFDPPPLMVKNMLILIAQKKRLGALNATQKSTSLCQEPILRKSRKTTKMSLKLIS